MGKKTLFVLCLVGSSLNADLIEFRAGYFHPTDSTMRKVYDKGGLDLQIAASNFIWKRFQLFQGFEYIMRNGKSLGTPESTEMRIFTYGLGVKYPFKISSWVDYYLTLGPKFFFVRVHNDSSFVNKHLNESGVGVFF